MPRIGITAYDLLISCPGDVIEYLDVIKESVESFNRVFGSVIAGSKMDKTAGNIFRKTAGMKNPHL
ncbi:MAG: hypothetical protein ACOX20_12555 [Limnochordia bacterium]